MSIAIKIEDLSKQYRLGLIGTGTLSHDLRRWWYLVRGKEDPYLKIGEVNDRSIVGDSDYIWALKDINLEVQQGEVLGIIGKNGAGKSTLLKILSKVTAPTTGKITYNGRIGSLLEVGTGFHPELTGRENIYLNGAILGMRKREINRKFDEIVDFSGCARYIDTPVKRYSSGMTVRLGFAIAAFLEPEILVVDEVLAVGDAEFQKKAIGKMQDASRNEGRTVLFVSHNMTAIDNLCNKLFILQFGKSNYYGDVNSGIKLYLGTASNEISDSMQKESQKNDEDFRLLLFELKNENGIYYYTTNQPIKIIINYEVKKELHGLRIGFDLIDDSTGTTVFRTFHDDSDKEQNYLKTGFYTSIAEIPPNFLKNGSYTISLTIGIHNVRWISYNIIKKQFSVYNIGGINRNYADIRPGVIMPSILWVNKAIKNGYIK